MPAQAQPLQSISIPRYELRSWSGSTLSAPITADGSSTSLSGATAAPSASSYYVFAVVVKLPVRSWTVYRRYSEFVRLDKCLASSSGVASAAGGEPGGAGKPAPAALPPKQRAREWKRTWSTLSALPSTLLASLGAGTSESQNSEEIENEKMFLRERQTQLEQYLKTILMHPDPAWRESEAFKTFIEWPLSVKMTTSVPASQSNKATTPVRSPPPRSAPERNTVTPTPTMPPARTLGQSAAPIDETSQTRSLDNTQLFNSQTSAMDQQDQQLLNLTAVLRRQRNMGEAINQELAEHTDLLTQLDEEVSHTQSNLARADAKMDRFDGGKAKNKYGIGRKF